MSTTTPNLGLTQPYIGDRGWGDTFNTNLGILDAVLAGATVADAAATVVFHTGTTNGTQIGGTATELLGFWARRRRPGRPGRRRRPSRCPASARRIRPISRPSSMRISPVSRR